MLGIQNRFVLGEYVLIELQGRSGLSERSSVPEVSAELNYLHSKAEVES